MKVSQGPKKRERPRAWEKWQRLAPPALLRQNPLAVLRTLELSNTSEGIFQMELQAAMNVRQSWLSKLIGKLRDAGWVSVASPKANRGRCLIKTTESGTKVLAGFGLQKTRSAIAPGRDEEWRPLMFDFEGALRRSLREKTTDRSADRLASKRENAGVGKEGSVEGPG